MFTDTSVEGSQSQFFISLAVAEFKGHNDWPQCFLGHRASADGGRGNPF